MHHGLGMKISTLIGLASKALELLLSKTSWTGFVPQYMAIILAYFG
jgi:hypothetical protein